MYQWFFNRLRELGMKQPAVLVSYLITLLVIAVICMVVRWITKAVLVKVMAKVVRRTRSRWDDIFYENKVFHKAANFVVPIVLSFFVNTLPVYNGLISRIAGVVGVAVFLVVFSAAIRSVNEIYQLYEISKLRPIHGLLQVVQVAVYIISGIVSVAILLNTQPLALLGGISAMTAVTSLIFKDAILGFVAGIQLTGNDMIRIGDWIEVPGQSADGTVVDLSMTTVKVENFDKTITSIPAYTMVSHAFINWRGMESSGGRRIKRAIHIDAADVRLCDDAMLQRFRRMALLQDYLDGKLREVEEYNRARDIDLTEPVNGRRITNIGTFRAYISAYLAQHPGIHKGMTRMVRQLTPDDRGLPLEIYAFANTTVWAEYEGIQADIFDHLYSVAPEFGLRIYQRPSSSDIRSIRGASGE